MSREFGDYIGGYFHEKIHGALEDLHVESKNEFHRKFIPLLKELYEVAYAISSVEACDSGQYRSILETINRLPAMRKALNEIDEAIRPYQDVIEEAIRQKTEE